MTKLKDLPGWDEVGPKKRHGECVCDCIPCKTRSCGGCNLYYASFGAFKNKKLCHELDDTDESYNTCLESVESLTVVVDVEAIINILNEAHYHPVNQVLAQALAQSPNQFIKLTKEGA